MICYKVVNEKRKSIIVHSRKYTKTYKKGTIVVSLPNSHGIFCFKTRLDATKFASWSDHILRVKTIGRPKKPKTIIHWDDVSTKSLNQFYFKKKYYNYLNMARPPKGTICYPAVEVLE